MKPVYLVVGFPRSGTSMMMRALDAGGIRAIHDTKRGDDIRRSSVAIQNYDPNPHGFYEVDDVRRVRWAECGGCCVKVIRDHIGDLPRSIPMEAVYMTRDPEEILRSSDGIGHDFPEHGNYWNAVQHDVINLHLLGIKVTKLHYPDVVDDPVKELSSLGWGFDVSKAAATVDPSLYRHRGAA